MRKSEISLMNTVFCLLVIFIHICSEPVTKLASGSVAHILVFSAWKLSSFVVQGFILLAGLKQFLSQKSQPYAGYIRSRLQKIVLPYILAVFVYYLYFIYRKYFGFSLRDLFGYILSGEISAQFYFVIAIVQFYLLKPLWELLVKKVPMALGIFLSLLVTVCGILFMGRVFGRYNDRAFTTYLIYWVIGCYIGAGYDRFIQFVKNHRLALVFAYLIVAVFEVVCAYYKLLPYYVAELVHILYCTSAIFACFAVGTKLGERAMGIGVTRWINSASFHIYLWHILVLFIIDQVMDCYGISDIGTRFCLRGVGTYIISIYLCGEYLRLKKKIRG